jgi:transcriptional regulator with XRE-family HTH domain
MAAHNPPVSKEAIELGQAFKRWREMNGLSQQDLHNYGTDRGVKLYNSQIAYFERGVLTPQPAFFVALAKLMEDLKNGGKS